MKEAKELADQAEGRIFQDGDLHEGEKASSVVYQIRNWLLDSSRKNGDSTVVEADTINCYYVVGFVGRYMDEKDTVSLRIISTSEDNGAAIISEYTSAGSTEQAFIDRETEVAPDRRGLILKSRPDGSCVWLTRKTGDVNYYFDESISLTYVCYYVGGGKPSWYYNIKNLIESEKMDDYLTGLTMSLTVDDPKGNLEYIALNAAAEQLQENVEEAVAVPAE